MQGRFRIIQAQTPEEKRQVYQLRYKILVEELSYRIPGATPEAGVFEAADKYATLLLALEGDTPIGTFAVNLWKDGPLDREVDYYQLQDFEKAFSRHAIIVGRKALVTEHYRGSSLFLRLFEAAVKVALTQEILFLFIDCSPILVRFYERLGFRRYARHFSHDDTGILAIPLCLVFGDKVYLERIQPPIARFLDRIGYNDVPEARAYFEENWTIGGGKKREEKVKAEDFFLLDDSAEAEGQGMNIDEYKFFKNVGQKDIQHFLARCEKVRFNPQDLLISTSDTSREMFLITEGYVEVEVSREGRNLAVATRGPGDLLGEINFLLGMGRSANIIAITAGEAIRISETVLHTLFTENPALTSQIYLNMSREIAERLRTTSLRLTQPLPL